MRTSRHVIVSETRNLCLVAHDPNKFKVLRRQNFGGKRQNLAADREREETASGQESMAWPDRGHTRQQQTNGAFRHTSREVRSDDRWTPKCWPRIRYETSMSMQTCLWASKRNRSEHFRCQLDDRKRGQKEGGEGGTQRSMCKTQGGGRRSTLSFGVSLSRSSSC